MKKFIRLLAAAGLALAILLVVKRGGPPEASLADVKWGIPVNAAAFDPKSLAGKVVVVDEWGVNCPPCIAALPSLAQMAEEGKDKGLVVVGLECQGSTRDEILRVIRKAGVGYPILSGGRLPGETGELPYACVFDAAGKRVFNGNPHDEGFEKAIAKALR